MPTSFLCRFLFARFLQSWTKAAKIMEVQWTEDEQRLVISLPVGAAIRVVGSVEMQVHSGGADVLGHSPQLGQFVQLNSPTWDSLLEIRAVQGGEHPGVEPGRPSKRKSGALQTGNSDEDAAAIADSLLSSQSGETLPAVLVFRACKYTFSIGTHHNSFMSFEFLF